MSFFSESPYQIYYPGKFLEILDHPLLKGRGFKESYTPLRWTLF
jgi:hypothetical protein